MIDAIRGLAVLGILFANIQSWSGYKFMPLEEINALPDAELETLFYSLHLWIVDGKFYAIFSMLFGVGFGIQYMKNQHALEQFLPVYRRRLCFLLMFGVLHALLWSGDILTLYALLAFVMVAMRGLPVTITLLAAITLLGFFALPHTLVLVLGASPVPLDGSAHKTYVDATPDAIAAAFGQGTWVDMFRMNLHNLYWRWMDFLPNGRITRVLGLFMLGLYLARVSYFSQRVAQSGMLLLWFCLGISLTAAAESLGANMTRWSAEPIDLIAKLVSVAGQVTLALGYMSVVGCLYRSRLGETLLYPLTQIGRMAFTNYLLQTVIGITLFYGVGLGMYASFGLASLWVMAIAIYSLQVLLSSLWLQYYRQGPVEWLWGCLTKNRLSQNRRQPATVFGA